MQSISGLEWQESWRQGQRACVTLGTRMMLTEKDLGSRCSELYQELGLRGPKAHVDQGVNFYGKFKQNALSRRFWFGDLWKHLPGVQRTCYSLYRRMCLGLTIGQEIHC